MSEFNLLQMPWIKVLDRSNNVIEVSLSDALLQAHEYKRLSGEVEAQNTALLRMMVGLLYSIFSRYDILGNESEFDDEDDAILRWEKLWNNKRFSEEALNKYFDRFYDRFFLIDDKHPFYQEPKAKMDNMNYCASKLNGEISKSGNKNRMFASRAGKEIDSLTYSEAARWLVYLINFDDASVKKGSGSGVGSLGKLGLIQAEGHNLFETLMLNLVMLNGDELWEVADCDKGICAIWESDRERKYIKSKNKEIIEKNTNTPINFAQLMTLQSRFVYLHCENGNVDGYWEFGGDFYDNTNAFIEPMTLWRYRDNVKNPYYYPKIHDANKQIWREFGTMAVDHEGVKNHRAPGVVEWINTLIQTHVLTLNSYRINYRFVSVKYGSSNSSVADSFSDMISLYSSLLMEKGRKWNIRIENDIKDCEACAKKVYAFSKQLQIAAGDSGDVTGDKAQQVFYSLIDPVVREWIYHLDPDVIDDEDYEKKLFDQIYRIAIHYGQKMVQEAGPMAMRGREISTDSTKGIKAFYWAPELYEHFCKNIGKICKGG